MKVLYCRLTSDSSCSALLVLWELESGCGVRMLPSDHESSLHLSAERGWIWVLSGVSRLIGGGPAVNALSFADCLVSVTATQVCTVLKTVAVGSTE